MLFLSNDGNHFLQLFANKSKFTNEEVTKHLQEQDIQLFEYLEFYNSLDSFNTNFSDYTLIYNEESNNHNICLTIEDKVKNSSKQEKNYIEHVKVFIY